MAENQLTRSRAMEEQIVRRLERAKQCMRSEESVEIIHNDSKLCEAGGERLVQLPTVTSSLTRVIG